MTSLKAEHAQVEQNLKNLKERFSPRLPMGSDTRHPSFKRGPSHSTEGSVASSSDTSSSQGIYDIPNVPPIPDFEDDYGHIPPPPPPPLPGQDISSMSTRSDSPSVSPAPSSTDVVGRCRALYDYHNANMEESQIPMHAGEEFLLIEGDCDGWTRVRRATSNPQYGDEGFVPSTWIEMI
jgi:hypothetical protein